MAKRDKLYTVNKWNKPFFEEERRKKLYPLGGPTNQNYVWGLNTDQGLMRAGIAVAPEGAGWNRTKPWYTSQGDQANTFDKYTNPYQEMIKTHVTDAQNTGGGTVNIDTLPLTQTDSDRNDPSWANELTKELSGIVGSTAKPISTIKSLTNNPVSTAKALDHNLFDKTPTLFQFKQGTKLGSEIAQTYLPVNGDIFNINPGLRFAADNYVATHPEMAGKLAKIGVDNITNNFTDTLEPYTKLSLDKGLTASKPTSITTNSGSGITDLGKMGVGLAANIGGEVGNKLISDGFETTPGTAISQIGGAIGTGISMVPGVGWWVGPAVTFGSKLIGGLYNRAFGSKFFDNGARSYINRLNALNPNGSNEYLANLATSIGIAPQATYRDGFLTHKGKNEAERVNEESDLAYNRFQRGIRDAFQNNNIRQLWNTYNDDVTYGAMGGKLNRKKCNCKSYGGYLDSATPTGFNFLSDLTNIQMQKNQNQGGTATSVGNSFMNTPDMGITFAKGGIMIKPENRGKLTRLKKRTGKTEAELYNDGNPEHRKMVVFARNARKWKKALGGKINYGEDKDIRNNSFLSGQTMYDLGGILQASGSNWGNVSQINEGGTHEENPYEGVQVGVDPEGTPNLVEEGEVIWNDYVFSNRITVPKEVCKRLRIGQKKNGYTFADAAKKLLVESKERPNDPISKNGLEANMQLLEDAQEEVKRKMEAEQAVEQFNSLPPEQQVAIMNQEGQRAQDAVAQEQMAQEIQNMPPEQQQAIAQQMMAEQAAAQGLGVSQGQPSPEEQAMMQQQVTQQQGINPQEAIAQASAMQQQALAGMALGGKLCFGGRRFADGGELNGEQPTEQADNEMAKYSDEELQDMIDDYQEAESGEVKVTKGKLARLKKKAEKAQAELERRHTDENEEQPQEARQEPSQEELQAAAQAQAMQTLQPIEGQPQEGMSPEQAMMMQQLMGGQPLMSPEEMAAAELLQLGNGQYAYGGRVNQFAYAGSLKPQPIGPGITREVQEPYKRHPDIPQEVYDWFLSLTPEERADLFNGSPVWDFNPADYNTNPDSWYEDTKRALTRPNQLRYWSTYVTTASNNQSMRKAILEAYKNRRSSDGKYIPNNIPMDIVAWYARLPKDQQQKIVANTKAQGKDFNGIIKYALSGTAGPVTDAIVKAYNTANGLVITNTTNNVNVPITQASETSSSIDYAPYFKGIAVDDIFGQVWDQMSSERRNGVSRKDFINNNHNLPANRWSDYNNELQEIYYATHPEARNSGWTFNSNPYRTYANVDFHDATSAVSNNGNGNKMVAENFYANDPAWNQLTEEERKLKGNELAAALEGTQAYRDFSKYLRDNRNSQYVKDYFNELANRGSKIAKNALADWDNMTASKFDAVIRNLREDASAPPNSPGNKNNNALGLGHFTPSFAEDWTNRYWIKDADGNYSQVIGGIADADKDKYIAINTNPYQVTVDNNNYNDYYYRLKTDADNATTTADNESNYLTVGWKPKMDWTGLALGVAPGLTGLAMQLGRGAPDMSELDKAVAAYERNTGTMVAPHLTHGLIRPAIIDPRVTENSLNARRLGTNRLLMNTGSTPSRGATILANDANTIGQLGQAMINNWRENRQQEQAAAAFNRETNTTNANILNQVDQFNAQTQSALARDAAQLRYNVAKDKIAARDAYYAGLMGNLGSVFKGGYEAWRENQRKNERDLLAASGVFGETNSLIDDWLGISKVDPKTHKVVRGYNTGMYYWINPNTGKAEYLKTPPLATNPINACGGKIKKNKKRKGYTF